MAAGWLNGLLSGGQTPDVQMPDGLPISGGQGSPLVDAFLNLQGQRLKDAFTAPRDAYTGDLQVFGPDGHPTAEAMDRANGMAGLAMTGSMPFGAPAGAIRSFGGAAAHDDPLAALFSALGQHSEPIAPDVRPMNRVDPQAASWDLYHGTNAPTDFARFDPNLPKAQRGHTPGSETGGVFLSPAADEATQYSGSIGDRAGAEAGPRVIRTTVDPGKTDVFDLPYLMEHDPGFIARARQTVIDDASGRQAAGQIFDERHARMLDEFKSARDLNAQLAEMGYPQTEVPQVQWGYGATGAAMQIARERGLDTAVLRGLSESNGGDQVVTLTPGRVRSYYDPDHVLYSGGLGGAGVGLPDLASSSDQKGKPVSAGTSGLLPSLADLPPTDLADLLARIQGQQAAAQAQPGSPQQLLFNRDSMGGGANPFVRQPQVDPAATGSLPQPQNVPLPPQRPSDADFAVASPAPQVSGMNPDARPGIPGVPAQPLVTAASTGNPAASNVAPVAAFDPLTGQPVSGNPKPMQAPGQGGPVDGAGRVATAAGNPAAAGQGGNFLQKFAQGLNNPAIGDLLLNVGIGLMGNRGFGPGIAAGLQGYQASQGNQTKNLLQQYQLMQQIQGQNAIRSALKAKGVAPEMIEAAALNPTVLSSTLSQMNQKTPQQIMAESQASAIGSRLGGPQLSDKVAEADALATVKDNHAKDDIVLQSDGRGGTIAVRKSSLFPDKTPETAGASGDGNSGDPNVKTIIPPNDKSIVEGADKTIMEKISAGYDKAQGAIGTLNAIGRQKQNIDNGIISGAGANWRQKAAELAAQYLGIDPSLATNSQEYQAAASQKSAELAKAVSQAGHTTNMDLQLGKTIAGGDLTKTEAALRGIIDAQETLARDTIDRHNGFVNSYAGRKGMSDEAKDRLQTFNIQQPEIYRYGQGRPNTPADPGAIMPSQNAIPSLDVGGTHQFQGITIKRVR